MMSSITLLEPFVRSASVARFNVTITNRAAHGYGFTRGASKTGTAGTGTVLYFGTPQHTAYPYRGVAGIHGLILSA